MLFSNITRNRSRTRVGFLSLHPWFLLVLGECLIFPPHMLFEWLVPTRGCVSYTSCTFHQKEFLRRAQFHKHSLCRLAKGYDGVSTHDISYSQEIWQFQILNSFKGYPSCYVPMVGLIEHDRCLLYITSQRIYLVIPIVDVHSQ